MGQGNAVPKWWQSRGAMLALAIALVFTVFAVSESGRTFLVVKGARPMEFAARHFLKRDPPWDARIKVYAFGDSSKEFFQADQVPLEAWKAIFESLESQRPRAVIIDNNFSMPSGLESAGALVKAARGASFPVYAGAFVAPSPIPGRPPFPFETEGEELKDRVAAGELPGLPVLGGYVYGPHPLVRTSFKGVGHAMFQGTDSLRAFYRLTPRHAAPALGLYAAKELAFRNGKLFADGVGVPLDSDGRFLVDYASPESYLAEIHPISRLVESIRSGHPPSQPPGSVILFLTQFTTGETKTIGTPFGRQAAALSLMATVNSVLTGGWLTRAPGAFLFILLFGAFGTALCFWLRPLAFWAALGATEAALALAGILAFTYAGVELPWLECGLGAFLSGLVLFVDKSRLDERRRRELRHAIDGLVSPSQLESVLSHPERMAYEPAARVVTVLFVDIVGFSLMAERGAPRAVFQSLRELIDALSGIVHRQGGIVDKTLGDGMLCFFGYRYDGTEAMRDHPDAALRTAMEIQRYAAERQLSPEAGSGPLYPLRIGMHTAAVLIGNLGGPRKIDMTIVGNGVNFAKRLESAADTYSILLSASSRDQLADPNGFGVPLVKRYVQIKHYDELIEVYECDPLAAVPGLREKATRHYREALQIERKSERWDVPSTVTISVGGVVGKGSLTNYSLEGLGVQFDRYLGRGVTFPLLIEPDDAELSARLRDAGLQPLICEVRWGRPASPVGVLLGLRVKNLSEPQRLRLIQELRQLVSRRSKLAA